MRMKLLVGIILCVLAIAGIGISIYAWNVTAESRKDYKDIEEDLVELKALDPPPDKKEETQLALETESKDAWDNAETNQRTAGMASTVSIILAVLGMLLIVLDVLKVKDPGEEKEAPPEDEEKPSPESY